MRYVMSVFIAALAVAQPLFAQAVILYGSDLSTGSLGTIDRVTGAWTPIGSHGTGPITGLAWHPGSDVLYGVSPGNNSVYTINQASGLATLLGPTGFSNVNTLVIDTSTNTMFGADLNTRAFFSVSPSTGAGTLIGTYPSGMSIEGLAYDPASNTLYGLEDNGDRIVVIDRLTGAAVPLPNPIGIAGISRGLDFDTQQNVIWATTVNPGRLIRVDPATGIGTLVASIPTFIQGIAFKGPPSALPEYQVNQLQSSADINAVLGSPSSPAIVNLGLSQAGLASVTSNLTGQPFDIALGGAPLLPRSQGAFVTLDGQILNIDLADPTLTLLFAFFQSPPFASFTASLASPTPLAASIQLALLDPAAPSGLRLSQPTRLLIQ